MTRKKILISVIFFSFFAVGALFNKIGLSEIKQTETKSEYTKTIRYLKDCEKNPYDEISFDGSERSTCYQSTVGKLIDEYGLKTAIGSLKGYMLTEQGKLLEGRRCHDLGHWIGIEAVKKGVPNKEILTECADWCIGGCLNGAAHVYVLTGHQPNELVEFCNVDGVSENLQRMCYHGLGHGYMENSNADVSKTMDFCEKIPIEMGQYECGHAAVMDYALLYTAPVRTIPEDIVGFCDNKQKVFQPSCYEFVGFLAYSRTVDTKDSFKACRRIPVSFRQKCEERIGEAYFSILQRDPEKIIKGCEIGIGEEIDNCIVGAVRSSIYGSDSSFGDLGIKFCSATTSEVSRGKCFKFLGGEIVSVHGQERRLAACNKLAGKDKDDCNELKLEQDSIFK